MSFVAWFVLGFLWASLLEWFLHCYVLHRWAKRLGIVFHIEHHQGVAKGKGFDVAYDQPLFKSRSRLIEASGLVLAALVHLPLLWVVPGFWMGAFSLAIVYYFTHHLAHQYPTFGWRWVPWHMEHHFFTAKKNFGVVTPLWDWLFNTLLSRRELVKHRQNG